MNTLLNKKKILLISHNYSPEPIGIGKVNGEMIHWLASMGHDCTVITTFPYYPQWKVQAPYKNRWYKREVISYNEGKNFTVIHRCPSFVPFKPTMKQRVIQDISFFTGMFWKIPFMMLSRRKFDLIITVAPPFHLAALGILLKKHTKSKLLYHVQDLQIEAAQNLKMIGGNKRFGFIYNIEKIIINSCDYVSAVSENMVAKIQQKSEKKVFLFPNWVNTSAFSPIETKQEIKTEYGYQADDVVFLYSGAIGEKQGLEIILTVAETIIKSHVKIKFIICGSGPYKEKLMRIADEKKLTNIKFLPLRDGDKLNAFLNMADYHLIMQKSTVSDFVMPSKLAAILSVGGVSIVTTDPDKSLYKLINDNDLGYTIAPDSHDALLELILKIELNEDYQLKKENARNYAVKNLDIDIIMNNFMLEVFD